MIESLQTQATPGRRLNDPVALRERNYPLDLWWVAAYSNELDVAPIQRWILELPVVLYRAEAGEAVTLDDRCPHRWAPLSAGHVEGEAIVCGYHGMRFGPDGGCTTCPPRPWRRA